MISCKPGKNTMIYQIMAQRDFLKNKIYNLILISGFINNEISITNFTLMKAP